MTDEPADAPPAEVPGAPPPPPVSSVPGEAADPERAVLSGIIPGTGGKRLTQQATKMMRVKPGLGQFAAQRLLEKPNQRESELLHHRAKVAFVDAAALTVPMLFSEIGADKPSKVRMDACLAVIKAAGIAVDSVPVSAKQREEQMAEDREAANMDPAELKERISQRLLKMRGDADKSEEKK